MYHAAFLIEGYCDHLPPIFERYWTFLILRTVELLPIWIMFINRIIDRIWISTVTLTAELLNLAQIEPCCGVIVACDSLWQPKIPPPNGVHSVDALVLYGNAIYFVWYSLFNGIKSRQNHTWQTLTRGHAIHTAPLFHHTQLFTHHRQIPTDRMPSHG